MNIACIVGGFPYLPETFILNQITGLIDQGHAVEIFALFDPQQPKIHPDILTYHLLDHVHYVPTQPTSKIYRIVKAMRLLGQHGRPDSWRMMLQAFNVVRFSKAALNLTILYKLLPFLNTRSCDVIYAHFGHIAQEFLFLKSLLHRPYVCKFYGFDVSAHLQQQTSTTYQQLFTEGDLFLALGDQMREQLQHYGCPGSKIRIHHIGININNFRFQPRQCPRHAPVHLLTVARLVEKKGLSYAIQAVARVAQTYPHLIYTIVGDGPLRGTLQQLIADLGVANIIRLAGWQDGREVQQTMDNAHIFLLPSVTAENGDMEGVPVSLMEAQAAGLPVLSTYHSGIPEVVRHGQSGFLVPEKDVDALSARLTDLLEHPDVWPQLGQVGRKIVEEEYNIATLNTELEHLLLQVIQNSNQRCSA